MALGAPNDDYMTVPPIAGTETVAWLNGRPIDRHAPALSVLDRGFTLADGVFETMRVARGVIIQLDAHLARLTSALARLRIPFPPHMEQTVADATRVLAERGDDAAVRLTVSRGIGAGVAPVPNVEPTCVLTISPFPSNQAATYERGLVTVVASGRRNEFAATSGLKTLSYTDAVLTLADARAAGADDAIMLDTSGHVAEGVSSNLFIVSHGDVRTPPPTCGILPGITRATVMSLIAVQEAIIVPSDLAAADELFLTSSLRGIAPVRSVDGSAVGGSVPGPITQQLMAAYGRWIDDAVADYVRDE